jgi:hypothetical protein
MAYVIDDSPETARFNTFADTGLLTAGVNDPVIGGVDRLASLLGGFDVRPSVPAQSLGAYAYPDAAAYQQSLGGVPAGYWGGAQQPQQPVAAAQPSVVMPQNMYDYQAPVATTNDVGGVNMSALDAFKNLGFNVEKPEGPAQQQAPQRPKGNDFS